MPGRRVFLVFVALLAAAPALPVPEFWFTLADYIGLSAIVALGLVLLTGVGGLTSFGQAAFVGLGAYTSAYLSTRCGVSPWLTLWVGLAITAAAAFLLGLITMQLSGHYLPLGTIAWGLSLFFLFGNLDFLEKYDGINGVPAITLFGQSLNTSRSMFYPIWGGVVLAIILTQNLLHSRPGRAVRALKGGVPMAEAMGVNTPRMKAVIFIYAALLAGLSGWLFAHLQRAVNPTPFSLGQGIEYLFMAVVGGVGHVWGAVLGATIVTVLKDVLQDVLPTLLGAHGNFENIVFGMVMVFMLQYARDGLWPMLRRVFPAEPAARAPETAEPLAQRDKPAGDERLLEVHQVRKEFGGLVAVNDVCFHVQAGEIVGLIGPNGAGKSITFDLVTGVLPVTRGEVRYRGEVISTLCAREIVQRGVARTFQHVQLLPTMTVLENVAIGAHLRGKEGLLPHPQGGVLSAVLRLNKQEEARLLYEAKVQLERVGLGEYLYSDAGTLPLGQQRLLEIARALCCDPALLLLDEPAAGLRFQEKQALTELLRQLKAAGMSLLLVEHDMEFVMHLADRLIVMEFGTKIAEGTPEVVQKDPVVLEAYLGGVA